MQKKQAKNIEKASKALLTAGKLPEHKRPNPTKDDLKRKFVMRLGRNGKPTLKEIK